jgi:flagellar biogenesis protein FliO
MRKLALRIVFAALAAPGLALASGDTGTGAVAEMQVSGKQFGMMVGALVALGVVIWLVAKFTTGGGKKK